MTALTIYSKMSEMQSAAMALHQSGFFTDVKSQAQALVKVMAGAELGLAPFTAMSGIHIVQGKPVLGANLIATLVKSSQRYDYRVKQADNTACVLTWYEGGKPVGESSFTMAEANAAGLTNKPTWKAYASDMLFARALTRGARRYAPSIFGGSPIYTPEEMGVDTDEDGHIVNVTPAPAVTVSQPVIVQQAAAATTVESNGNGATLDQRLADDELVIRDAGPREFIATAAVVLDTDEAHVKERLRELGYSSIPGAADARMTIYRRVREAIRADRGRTFVVEQAAEQDDLFGEKVQPALVPVEATSNGAYAE